LVAGVCDFDVVFGGIVGVFAGEGVKGVEKGWAAEVEVAGGGFEGLGRVEVVERVREVEERGIERRYRRWVQRWQIIVAVEYGMVVARMRSRSVAAIFG